MKRENWPELSFKDAKETYETIHLWTQIAGKIKLAHMPWTNHSWHVTLFVTPEGLSTGDIPSPEKHFQINFDFLRHRLQIITSKNEREELDLPTLSVATCYLETLSALQQLDIKCHINPMPNEIADATPFHLDHEHAHYQPIHAEALHHALLKTHEVFTDFRSKFIGKCSPVHFFWGGFDLAVTRFSGNPAPLHPGGVPNMPDWVAQEAYSHEVNSSGFWPGNDAVPFAAFYNYHYPEPIGLMEASIQPKDAYYHEVLREFILPYQAVQEADQPSKTLMNFLQSTYEAGARLANWDREKLERKN